MQVVDIPSSPEPSSSTMGRRMRSASRQPGPSKKRPRLSQLAREPSVMEVIELSDSDDNKPVGPSPRTHRTQPGPSQQSHAIAPNVALAFGEPNYKVLADAPGPSRVARPDPSHGGPLFLPGSDDEQQAVHPLHALVAQDVVNAAQAHPQPAPPEAAAVQIGPDPIDPIDECLVRVLEIVPDVQHTYVLELIQNFMQSQPANVVEFVLHSLFENPSYPKADRKGKHKRDELDDPNVRNSSKPKVDYTSKDRVNNGDPHYFEYSLEQLMTDFPRIPKPHIRSRLFENRFYAPTYLLLAEELKRDPPPFRLKSTNSVVGKGKARRDAQFDQEREWVLLRVAELATERDAAQAAAINEQEYENNGEGIECGCCFSAYPFDQMIQCPEAHLFCKSCMTSYASNLLGEHNPNIICMDQSGCKLPFPESELGRFLSSKLLDLYYRVKQQKEIEAAGLENLEECPFCEYKCVIENETEKLFRCENAACTAITCRTCKKPDHLPKSCKEADEDKHLDAQHVIEEAMTQALMRNCPKCQKSFIKEMGCNKMTCPHCRTMSCYICRKVIKGYEHFSNPPPYSGNIDRSKCNLWDPVEQRHVEEVSEAAKRALAELRKSRPDVDESSLKVDIPVAKAPRPGVVPGYKGGGAWPAYVGGGAARLDAVGAPIGVGMAGGVGMGMAVGAGRGPPNGVGMGMGIDAVAPPRNGVGVGMAVGAVGAPRNGVAAGAGREPPNGTGVGVGNQFMFGVGQVHQFALPPVAAPPQLWAGPARVPAVPEPAIPLALARGRRVHARPPVPAQPVMAAGDGGRQRKAR